MLKKLFSVLLVLVLCMTAVTCYAAPAPKGPAAGPAAGGPAGPKGPAAPAPAPAPKPVGPAEKKRAEDIIAKANADIYALVVEAQATPEDDTEELIAETNAIAAAAKAAVAKLGLEAGCEYTTYIVDGKAVSIDPLYVINPIKRPKPADDGGNGGK